MLYVGHRLGVAGFSRQVGVKVIHPHLANDPTFVRMFIDEALLAARIDHPNVVRVEELGEHEGTYFLAMEFVQGASLSELIRALAARGRLLSPETAVSIAVQVADALHAAHETRDDRGRVLGVVHRDVSPQNILLSRVGQVKLIDFGIAKARRGVHDAHSAEGDMLQGKLRYMSPEQLTMGHVDRRSDVYALAIVLWEMLAGRRLFSADSDIELIERVSHPPPQPAPSAFADAIGAELDEAVLRALAPGVTERTATARRLRDELVAALPRALVVGPTQLSALVAATFGANAEPPSSSVTQTHTPCATPPTDAAATSTDSEALTRFTIPLYAAHAAARSEPRTGAPARGKRRTMWAGLVLLAVLGAAGLAVARFTAWGTGSAHAPRAPRERAAEPRESGLEAPRLEPPLPAPPPAPTATPSAVAAPLESAPAPHNRARTRARRAPRATAAPQSAEASGRFSFPIIERPP